VLLLILVVLAVSMTIMTIAALTRYFGLVLRLRLTVLHEQMSISGCDRGVT